MGGSRQEIYISSMNDSARPCPGSTSVTNIRISIFSLFLFCVSLSAGLKQETLLRCLSYCKSLRPPSFPILKGSHSQDDRVNDYSEINVHNMQNMSGIVSDMKPTPCWIHRSFPIKIHLKTEPLTQTIGTKT